MNAFTKLRVRTKVHPDDIERMRGKVLSEDSYDVLLKGPTEVSGPTGQLIAKYIPGALRGDVLEASYATLHDLRQLETTNRGYASGTQRVKGFDTSTRTYAESVKSAIIGSFDPGGQQRYCRLTAWSGRETEKFSSLFPLFELIDGHFREQVPDRYEAQLGYMAQTHKDWRIGRTAFTTVTVNNSYPTGVHVDKGDLDDGFSTLSVLRRGAYSGGVFVFAEYRLAVDMQDGDLLLMDAHQWHGNTAMFCRECGGRMGPGGTTDHDLKCGAERISVVAYYRTKIKECASMEEETAKAAAYAERRADLAERDVLEAMAEEAKG